jgi:wobble nucleotide-excising tRNase
LDENLVTSFDNAFKEFNKTVAEFGENSERSDEAYSNLNKIAIEAYKSIIPWVEEKYNLDPDQDESKTIDLDESESVENLISSLKDLGMKNADIREFLDFFFDDIAQADLTLNGFPVEEDDDLEEFLEQCDEFINQ